MRKTLYLKFILAYLLFGIFGFIVVATFVSNMLEDHCLQSTSDALYREATQIANTYAADLYSSETSLDTVSRQITVLAGYSNAQIWIMNPSGRMVAKSGEKLDPGREVYIKGFNPSAFAGKIYTVGDFFGSFDEPMISVLAPITGNYKTNGYVVIHTALSGVRRKRESF